MEGSHRIFINGTPSLEQDFRRTSNSGGAVSEMVLVQYEITGNRTVHTVIDRSPLYLNLSRRYGNVRYIEDKDSIVTRNLTVWADITIDLERNGLYNLYLDRISPELNLLTVNLKTKRVCMDEGRPGFRYHIQNYGEESIEDVAIHGFFRLHGSDDEWTFFQEDRIEIPGMLDAGSGYAEGTIEWFDTPEPGIYSILFVLDPEHEIDEKDYLDNRFILSGILEVRARPVITITSPLQSDLLSGTVEIRGQVSDLYDSIGNSDQIYLYIEIDGVFKYVESGEITLESNTSQAGVMDWSHTWHTDGNLVYSVANGEVGISAMCRNDQPDFCASAYHNISVGVHNRPHIEWEIEQYGVYPIIGGSVRDLGKNVLRNTDGRDDIELTIDDGNPLELFIMNGMWEYAWEDFADYTDGEHVFHATAFYDAGGYYAEIDSSLVVTINSPGTADFSKWAT